VSLREVRSWCRQGTSQEIWRAVIRKCRQETREAAAGGMARAQQATGQCCDVQCACAG
jgi:hypothetical protein